MEMIIEMFSYPFMVRAFTVGALVALCSALLGVSLVLKRYSMIGDGLSHVGFGALAIAASLNVAPLAVAIPVVIVAHADEAEDMYGTITHNRARGTHLLEPMKAIVKKLLDEGKDVKEIGKQLGMKPEEVFRLSDFSKEEFIKLMAKGTTYSRAEIITRV